MSKYRVLTPLEYDMSPNSYIVNDESRMETKEAQALWDYNKSREHDGLAPKTRLPKGTKFIRIEE